MLSFFRTAEQDELGEPDGAMLIAVVKGAGGMDAVALSRHFEAEGFHRHAVQRAIQRALERGELQIGNGLRLYAHEEMAA